MTENAISRLVVDELTSLATSSGTLTPSSVLERARDPENPLHKYFEWDDSEAAEKYRLQQAGVLIRRAKVTITPANGGAPVTVRAFTSLMLDRKDGSGYRLTEEVLRDPQMSADMLGQALVELRSFRDKYRKLNELSSVFIEIDRLVLPQESFLAEAVNFATQLEGKGYDRHSAAQRAANTYGLQITPVIEQLRLRKAS